MEYTLPHAVLALLREEATSTTPKSYFIRSGTKSTKITLIYSKRKHGSHEPGVDGIVGVPCVDINDGSRTSTRSMMNRYQNLNKRSCPPFLRRHQKSYSQSSEGGSSIDSNECIDSPNSNRDIRHLRRRLQTRVNGGLSTRSSHCHTDTTTPTTITSIDSQCVRSSSRSGSGCRDGYECQSSPAYEDGDNESNKGNDDDDDDDDDDDNDDDDDDEEEYNSQFIALSPSCHGDEDNKPPLTPGRDFHPSESPRPPTPNLQNYETILSSNSNSNTTNNNTSSSNTNSHNNSRELPPSRQATVEYDSQLSPPFVNADPYPHPAPSSSRHDYEQRQIEHTSVENSTIQPNNNTTSTATSENTNTHRQQQQQHHQHYSATNTTASINGAEPGLSSGDGSNSRKSTPHRTRKSSKSPRTKNSKSSKGRKSLSPAVSSVPPITIQAPSPEQAHHHHHQQQQQQQQHYQLHQQQYHQQKRRMETTENGVSSQHGDDRPLQRLKSWHGNRR